MSLGLAMSRTPRPREKQPVRSVGWGHSRLRVLLHGLDPWGIRLSVAPQLPMLSAMLRSGPVYRKHAPKHQPHLLPPWCGDPMASRALVGRIRGQPLRDPKPHPSRPTLRRCRELLMAPRARLGKIRDKPQSFVIGMCVCNPALQFLSCPGGLTKWIHGISWRFRRIMHSRMRRRLLRRPALLLRHGWRTLCSWNHVLRAPRRCGR